MTQSNTKQLPTCLDPHILVPSVIPFVLTCVESLSHFVALHPSQNNGVNHQKIPYLFFFELRPPIKLSTQPNMCLCKPMPLTCNIAAGTDPSNPYFRSPKGTLSKALDMFFLHKFVKPSSVKCACTSSLEQELIPEYWITNFLSDCVVCPPTNYRGDCI
jgi:hypothetical protein